MDYTELFSAFTGAAKGGAFGKKISHFTGNPAPASSSPVIVQTVPQSVNPVANPGAQITRTYMPSASFFKTESGGLNMPLIIGSALAVLVTVYFISRR